MKKIMLSIMLLMFVFTDVSAQKIHWLLFIDTKDRSVGALDVNGRDLLKGEFVDPINSVLNDAGIQSTVYDCYGDDCSPEKLKNVVNSLHVASDDIIFFYYIGHGGRSVTEDDDQHPWPQMCLGQHDASKFVDLGVLHNQLKAKNPRLLVTVGMCCNSYANIPRHNNDMFSTSVNYALSYEMSDEERELVKNLFTKQCGDLLATSASPGETSKGAQLGNYKAMDCYTTCLVASFDKLLEYQELDKLETLFNSTGELVSSLNFVEDDGTPSPQNPRFKSSLRTGSCPIVEPNPGTPVSEPGTVNISDLQSVQELLDAAVRNRRIPSSDIFAPNAVVRVLARDGKTQIDRMPASRYMSRISSSKLIMKSVPVRVIESNGKIGELHVKEILTERRY